MFWLVSTRCFKREVSYGRSFSPKNRNHTENLRLHPGVSFPSGSTQTVAGSDLSNIELLSLEGDHLVVCISKANDCTSLDLKIGL